jgi:hypothetical protein
MGQIKTSVRKWKIPKSLISSKLKKMMTNFGSCPHMVDIRICMAVSVGKSDDKLLQDFGVLCTQTNPPANLSERYMHPKTRLPCD